VLLLGVGASCAPEVPEEPSWIEDVRPILAANCLRCHMPPQSGGAPTYFRLDRYDSESTDVSGAATMANTIANVTSTGFMPPAPRFPLTRRQIDILSRWAASMDPSDLPPAPPPRPGNRPPEIRLLEPLPAAGEDLVSIWYEIRDPDRDLVYGRLEVRTAGGLVDLLPQELGDGRGRIEWNAASAGAGRHELVARLDDGSGQVEISLGTYERLPTAARSAPPVRFPVGALAEETTHGAWPGAGAPE
jgi:hypothetical protein